MNNIFFSTGTIPEGSRYSRSLMRITGRRNNSLLKYTLIWHEPNAGTCVTINGRGIIYDVLRKFIIYLFKCIFILKKHCEFTWEKNKKKLRKIVL